MKIRSVVFTRSC